MRGPFASEVSSFIVANAFRWLTTMPFSFLDVIGFRFAYVMAGKAAVGVVVARSVFEQGTEVRSPRCRVLCPRWLRTRRRLRLVRHRLRPHPCDFWAVSQEMGADFAMVLDFCAVFDGVVRCRLRRPGETPVPAGVSGRFGLRNRPEVASGVCLR